MPTGRVIAKRLSARHIIVTLFSLSVYIYTYKCASRLGMLPVTPKTTNHTSNHMCVGILKLFKHINTLQLFSTQSYLRLCKFNHGIFIHQTAKVRYNDACNGQTKSVYWPLIGASLSEPHTSETFVGSSFYEYKR